MRSKTIFHLVVIGLVAFVPCYFLFKFIYGNLIKEEIEMDNYQTDLVRYHSGKERLRQAVSGKRKFLTPKYDRISFRETDDSLAIFFMNDHRGYLSLSTGAVIIPAVYTHAWQFSGNLALVTNEKNQLGIINRQGKLIAPFKYNYVPHVADNLDDKVYSFSDGKCIITDNNDIGLIDSLGHEIIAPVYQNIIMEPKGYYSTLKNDKWGLLDSSFSIILDNGYDNISVLEAGLLVEKDNRKYLLSLDGKKRISENIYSDCYPLQFISSDNESNYSYDESDSESGSAERLCKGWTVIVTDKGTGLMRNADHEIIVPCVYDEIKAISEELFRCQLSESYVIYNKNGQIL